MEIDARKEYSTHTTMLLAALFWSNGDVIELGGGVFSTPLLHWVCKAQNRNLISYENSKRYFEFEKKFQSKLHRIRFITDWDEVKVDKHYGVVFIDHHPSERRAIDAIRFANNADFIVIHDSDRYDYKDVWPHFKYIRHWKEARPWTTVVSNFVDVTRL